ncbi:G-D-S-L family lipolytic protein [Winogradskyella sp. SYSU M77433]|uniref:G-D-S-L family lipolytic protein n=1 Tax=Winogradskyella sp. SYSU M77433 TaxID=3042722 RepID=UPI00247FFC0E|nr:G-D-S-L family lipolytic protein [Winogradskyella sp. SYSU M77433]MDH7912227.1 G-D-S-L family lipolytic protein [Winogradskyella sp. SYSU M77433]
MKTIKYIALSLLTLGMMSCENELVDDLRDRNSEDPIINEEFTQGIADFSNYIAIGNSLTAGYTDNALYRISQENSTPAILAQQFATLANGGDFNQPLTNDNIGGLLYGGTPIASPRLYVYVDPDSNEDSCPYPNPDRTGPSILGVSPEDPNSNPIAPTTDIIMNNPTGPFNNLGVPGAKSFHLLAPGYGDPSGVLAGTANPYFVRMASNPSTTVLADAVAQNPTFFSLWIGNNDVLGYALSGGESNTASSDYNPITDTATFTTAYNTIVNTLVGTGADGIIGNIPNITSIPHFTTVPYAPLDPCNPDFAPQIPLLNSIFGALNPIFSAVDPSRAIVFSETEASPVIIRDESLADISSIITAQLNASPTFPAFIAQFGLPASAAPLAANLLGATYGQSRQATEEDLLVLPSSNVIGTINTSNVTALVGQGLPQALAAQFSVEGISLPLADKWVLIPSEQNEISTAIDSFNTIIESAASANGFAFLDANTLLDQLSTTGITSSGYILTSDLVTGGAFSLDGVHPNSRGYALIANEMLKAIDLAYGSNFKNSGNLVDISNYSTTYSPTLQ